MSGKPAARMGDMTKYGGPIVQGSMGVMIGAPTGVACSVCPGGVTSGNPVTPLLGAKVLPGETDLALPGPLPFVLSRSYSSYRTKTPAPVGFFGPGWKAPFDIRVQIREDELILNDNGGRSIHFDPLLPGETAFSRSESLWLARGGALKLHESNVLHVMWQTLPEALRLSPHLYLATNSAQGPWWILGWPERIPGADEALPGQQYDEETGLHYNRHRYYNPRQGRYITQDPIGLKGGLNPYIYPLNPVTNIDPLGLSSFISNMGYGVSERSSLGLHMCENGASPEDIANAMSPPPPRPIATGECRASAFAAAGSGISGTISANEKTGPGGLMSFPVAAVGARASATCGLKFRDPDAKDLKVNAGASFGLGIFSIEMAQTSTWPELYIGIGPGIGPEVKIPYTPSVSVPVFQ